MIVKCQTDGSCPRRDCFHRKKHQVLPSCGASCGSGSGNNPCTEIVDSSPIKVEIVEVN